MLIQLLHNVFLLSGIHHKRQLYPTNDEKKLGTEINGKLGPNIRTHLECLQYIGTCRRSNSHYDEIHVLFFTGLVHNNIFTSKFINTYIDLPCTVETSLKTTSKLQDTNSDPSLVSNILQNVLDLQKIWIFFHRVTHKLAIQKVS